MNGYNQEFIAQVAKAEDEPKKREVGCLYAKQNANGHKYYHGYLYDENHNQHKISVLTNGFKKRPNQPDLRIYWGWGAKEASS